MNGRRFLTLEPYQSDELAAAQLCSELQNDAYDAHNGEIARAFLQRIKNHLLRKFEAELTGKRQRITTEQAALSMLKGASLELEAAGTALKDAAAQLRDAAKRQEASQAMQAGSRAMAAAGGLVPS